ncbi:hypothetical protein D3C78_1178470 [compost metagenome]
MKIRGNAARRSDPACTSGNLPFAISVLLHEHPVIMDPSARELNLNALLRDEPPFSFPFKQEWGQPGFMNLLYRYNLPILLAPLNQVQIISQLFDPYDSAASCTVNGLNIDRGVLVQ